MPIPPIPSYPMPRESELPENRARWRPEPGRAVLLVHDMQQYFIDAYPSGASPVCELVEHIADLKRTADRLAIPVFYTAQPGAMTREDRGLLHDFWGPGMDASAAARRIVDRLEPAGGDVVLTKWRYSAFHRTELRQLMERAGRDQLVVCGVYGHIGCLMTMTEAFTLDIQAFLVGDAVADFSRRDHQMTLDYVAGRCGVVLSTRALIGALQERSAMEVSRGNR
jgi:bifunctional isochorismate lyase/aryl carrier protein